MTEQERQKVAAIRTLADELLAAAPPVPPVPPVVPPVPPVVPPVPPVVPPIVPPVVPPPPPPDAMGTAAITVSQADHVVSLGDSVKVLVTVTGATEAWVITPGGRIDLPPTGGTLSFLPKVSGPFPVFARSANGGVVVHPMSVIVRESLPPLDPTAPPTASTVKDGDLDDPETWGGTLPDRDETALIRGQHACTYSSRNFRCGRLVVEGELVQTGGVLRVTDFHLRGAGEFRQYAQSSAKALVLLENRPRHPNDTEDEWRAFKAEGDSELEILGWPRTPAAYLASEALAGGTSLSLASAVSGWKVGQKLYVPGCRQERWEGPINLQGEVVVVRGVSADGKTVYLLKPLKFDHEPGRDADGKIEDYPEVINLSGPNAGILTADPTDPATRGHVVLTGKTRVYMHGWVIHGTGRYTSDPLSTTNRSDRNPLRLDGLTGPAEGVVAPDGKTYSFVIREGISVEPAGDHPGLKLGTGRVRWGVTLVNSSFGLIEGNVFFNWAGAGVCALAGGEWDDTVRSNVSAVLAYSPAAENGAGYPDVANTGTGFWSIAPNVRFVNNRAYDCNKGYTICCTVHPNPYSVSVPTTRGQLPLKTINISRLPLLEFRDNKAAGVAIGATFWRINYLLGESDFGTERSLVDNLVAWNVGTYGVYLYEVTNLTLNMRLRSLGRPTQGTLGVYESDYIAEDLELLECDVQGFNSGWRPNMGNQRAVLCYFRCWLGVEIWPPYCMAGSWGSDASTFPGRDVTLDGCKFAPFDGGNSSWEFKGDVLFSLKVHDHAANLVSLQRVFLKNHQGVPGNDARLYAPEQAADFVMPASVGWDDPQPSWKVWACPEVGLTNAQARVKYNVCLGGEITPTGVIPVPGTNAYAVKGGV